MTLKKSYWGFQFPTIVFLVTLTIFPFIYSIFISLTDYKIINHNPSQFVGLQNYKNLFENRVFLTAFGNTALIVISCVFCEFIFGCVLAFIFWEMKSKLKSFFLPLIIIPMGMAPVAVALMWKYMFNSTYGIVNFFLSQLNLDTIDWLGSKDTALISLVIVDVWQWTPLVFIIILAGLDSISKKLIEMMKIDGANQIQMYRYLVLPNLLPFLLIAVLLRVIDSFKLFDIVYVLTEGGPGTSTETLSLVGYRQGFIFFNTQIAATESLVLLLIIILITGLLIKVVKKIAKNEQTSFSEKIRSQ